LRVEIEAAESDRTARPRYASVRIMGLSVVTSLVVGTATMLSALVVGGSVLRLILLASIPLAAILIFIVRSRRHVARPGLQLEAVPRSSLLPAMAASTVFVAYATVLVLVHAHTVTVQE
jgi:hypothetical protein